LILKKKAHPGERLKCLCGGLIPFSGERPDGHVLDAWLCSWSEVSKLQSWVLTSGTGDFRTFELSSPRNDTVGRVLTLKHVYLTLNEAKLGINQG
jgi:hypothetical protein